jgi:hypothetical protein
MTKSEIADSKVVVAARFFENVWGSSAFVTRVVPLFIGLSALGNVFAQSCAMPRVKQELAKEGVLPLSRFWASDWPFNAPSGAIFLHWIFTSALILGSQTSDVYVFVTNVFIYSGNWIKGRSSSHPTGGGGGGDDADPPDQSSSPSVWSISTLRRRNGGPSSVRRSAARRC